MSESVIYSFFVDKETQHFIVRLFEYIPGDLLRGKPCTIELCYSVGQTAAKLDKALMVIWLDRCLPELITFDYLHS